MFGVNEIDLADDIELGLSELFVRALYEAESSEIVDFPMIPNGAMQNWKADCFLSRREFW